MDEADAPHGLNMSLDDIIKENSKNKKLHNKNRNNGQQYKKGSTQQQGSRGRGRGGRGPSRGTGRGNQSYARGQQQAVQDFTQNYAQAYANPDRIVMVQDPDTSYRQYQDCYRDDYGNVIFTFKNSELVKVSRAGDVTLNTRGENGREFRGATTLKSLNDALNCLDISIRPSNPKFPSDPAGHWNILDGKALLRFREGLTLPAKGAQHAARGQTLMAAIKQPELPHALAATAASNAAAAQAGLIPPGAFGFGGGGFGGRFMGNPFGVGAPVSAGGMYGQNGSYDNSYNDSMSYGKESSQIRRDKARGRHMPY